MISKEVRDQYKVTIGIECHVQLKTATKLFSSVDNDARNASPNSLISHICMGLPGALPVLNEKAIDLATRAAFALKTTPQTVSKFDRKHYFYPDLPMGYQITQLYEPIILGGSVTIQVGEETKVIGITRAHLEADAGKSSHPEGKDYSLVDLNRAGTPLLEIVSEPDISSPAEARAYAHELFLLMKFAGVSDCDLYHGNMRFDVNVSVSQNEELGTRTETKNLNSFRSVEKAAEFEIDRQIQILEKGEQVVQETRGWDDAKQRTQSQRGKENAHDYRYMPEPDVPPVVLSETYIQEIADDMPALPDDWRKLLQAADVSNEHVGLLLSAHAQDEAADYLGLIESVHSQRGNIKQLVNWLVNVEIPFRTDETSEVTLSGSDRGIMYEHIGELVAKDKISSTNARLLIVELLQHNTLPEDFQHYAEQQGLLQVSDAAAIDEVVLQVIQQNPGAVEDIKNGEVKAIGFLVGQVMKASQGKANPGVAQEAIRKHLGIKP